MSYSQIKSLIPKDKDTYHIWLRFALRPLSILVTIPLLKTGISANFISYFSALICLLSAILIAMGNHYLLIGAIGFNLFALLDCIDGNIARFNKQTGPFGRWADALGGYFASALVLPSVGIAVGLSLQPGINQSLFIGMGVLAGLLNILSRIIQKKLSEVHPDAVLNRSQNKHSIVRIIDSNIGITGFLMPAVLIGVITNSLIYVLILFSAYYIIAPLAFIMLLIYKVESLKKSELKKV